MTVDLNNNLHSGRVQEIREQNVHRLNMLEKYERDQEGANAKQFTSDGRLTGVNNSYDPIAIARD